MKKIEFEQKQNETLSTCVNEILIGSTAKTVEFGGVGGVQNSLGRGRGWPGASRLWGFTHPYPGATAP